MNSHSYKTRYPPAHCFQSNESKDQTVLNPTSHPQTKSYREECSLQQKCIYSMYFPENNISSEKAKSTDEETCIIYEDNNKV